MTWMEWYNSLAKPSWTPAPSTIGLIWQILYALRRHLRENNGKPAVQSIVVWCVVCLLVVVGFVFLALANSLFSWGLMPEAIERVAHRFLVWLIPME